MNKISPRISYIIGMLISHTTEAIDVSYNRCKFVRYYAKFCSVLCFIPALILTILIAPIALTDSELDLDGEEDEETNFIHWVKQLLKEKEEN